MDVQVAIHTDTLNESGFVETTTRGDRRPHDPHVPHRRRRRRPRARHHQGGGRAERAALVDQPDAPVHGQHDRRASRHADGVPPPRPGHRRGRRVRGVAHPPRDDRGGGHPARPGRVLDAVVRLAGDGPRRRGHHPHLADRAQDEGAARQARPRSGPPRQLPREALHRQVHDQPGDRARRFRMSSARSSPASSPTSSCGSPRSSA